MAPPAKRRKCTGKFQNEWVAMFGGMIVQSKTGEKYARCSVCTVCSRDVKVAASGLYDVTEHMESNLHTANLKRCSAYVFPALNPFRLTFLRMRESDTTLVAMRDVYFSHPAAPTVKTVPIDVSAHARVNYFVNRRKFVVSEMFYSYLRHYMSSGVHHPAVAKHDNVQ